MEIISRRVNQTLKFGKVLSKNLKKGDIICLFGQLGSGKTVLAKGIGEGLGINRESIISSSFILIRQYTQGRIPMYHFDLYRLKRTEEINALGYEEYLYGDGITVIEWADRLKYCAPEEYLKIEIFFKGNSKRLFKFSYFGKRYKVLLDKIKRQL